VAIPCLLGLHVSSCSSGLAKHFSTRNRPLVTLRRNFNPNVSRWASRGALGVGLFLVACSGEENTPGGLLPGANPSSVPSGASTSEGSPSAPTAGPSAGAPGGSSSNPPAQPTGMAIPSTAPPPPSLDGADVGSKVLHRLSNVEYDNTVNYLLGTSRSLADAFVHEEADGFDNIATALSMSPRQFEDYFAAAGVLADEVFGNPALRSRIVSCTLGAADPTCAQASITSFGLRAFRRPLEPDEQRWLEGVYDSALTLGETPDGAMQHVVRVMLSAPQFLYRAEFDSDLTSTAAHPLSGFELASRLSYALWANMPDDTLLSLASSGELSQPAILEAQVERMLDAPAAETLATNFASQWLGERHLSKHVASTSVYPMWTTELGQSMQREMELYFLDFLRGDRPYSEFLTADFNYVDAALAGLYGFEPPSEPGFSRVEVTNDLRQGFVGLAGFLTHTSRETRTSPIIRGSWILDALWCLKLVVPANLVIAPLPEPTEEAPKTVRELIAVHRADPACSVCHNLIDPIGLTLEHFDGIGRYREAYDTGLAIDASSELPSGAPVDGLVSLSEQVAADPRFVPCAAQKFNSYALGRATTDAAYMAAIVSDWGRRGLTLRNLIKASVLSDSFLQRRAMTP
jgi:Protein of unknown function (DUF1592)/Protein of unknown function (DUF1588)/Protein of unknown function (DUF1595)/Protein of unknown function (DUF1587)/Protein of unknown function (DUF1585)